MKLTVIILLLALCHSGLASAGDKKQSIKLSDVQKQSFGIKVSDAIAVANIAGAGYPARVVVPNSQLQVISARLGGLIESVLVAEGDELQKGQTLANIQSPGLLELQRDLLKTLTQLTLARSTLDRDKLLMEEGIVPKRRYQESLSVWQALQTEKEQQFAALQYSGMTLEDIKTLAKTRKLNNSLLIKAPFDGVLLEQMAIPGEKLESADPLFKVAQLSPLWLEIHVPVASISDVVVGDKVMVSEFDIKGEVITLGRQVHEADQGTLVRALIIENIEQLRPGQFVQVRLMRKSSTEYSYVVPTTAITRIGQQAIVFLETQGGFEAIDVDVLGGQDGQQIIGAKNAITRPIVDSGVVALKAILATADGEDESGDQGN